jgi:hypothetical protein
MGAPTAQVQSSQTSQPAGKNAGQSPSSEKTTMSMGGLSGQPGIGQPNTNGNTSLDPITPQLATKSSYIAPFDGETRSNPYPNTVGQWDNQSTQTPAGKGKGA